jgi:hypothetical protein
MKRLFQQQLNLAPLRYAIGMVEYWNNGIMGFGKMVCWIIGKIHLAMGVGANKYLFSF